MVAGKYSRGNRIVLLMLWVCLTNCTGGFPDVKEVRISDAAFNGTITFRWIDKNGWYTVNLYDSVSGGTDRIIIPFEIYDVQTGDINHDGRTDICVGIIKPTPFDPVLRKRLFIFQIDGHYLKPLWLGSRLAYSFEQFDVNETSTGCVVRTLEKRAGGKWSVSEYRWQNFGLAFVRHVACSVSFSEAKELLKINQKSILTQ